MTLITSDTPTPGLGLWAHSIDLSDIWIINSFNWVYNWDCWPNIYTSVRNIWCARNTNIHNTRINDHQAINTYLYLNICTYESVHKGIAKSTAEFEAILCHCYALLVSNKSSRTHLSSSFLICRRQREVSLKVSCWGFVINTFYVQIWRSGEQSISSALVR